MKNKHTVSLCMIVKNEEKHLRKCLESMKDIVDEIVIIDTGSTDGTMDIAKAFNAKLGFFEWNQNFSDARNKSLELATMDWVIVLDADEYLRSEDRQKLIEAFEDFSYDGYIIKTLNFSGTNVNSYITNLNQRIFKNNGMFEYRGAIHEQVVNVQTQKTGTGFKIIDVGFYHTGYLGEVVKEKNKVERNMTILKQVAEEEPDNMFTLFNLANEYSQCGDNDEALRLYNKAYGTDKFGVGFMPKLVMFRLIAMINLNLVEEALTAIEEGLIGYPDYTELVYYRGTLERKKGHTLKAIRSFEQCLKMGKPRPEIEFQKMCYDFGPLFNLAEIYQEQGEFEQAVKLYNRCLTIDSTKFQIVYPIFDCLKGLKLESTTLVEMMKKYFSLQATSNQIVFVNLLVDKECYAEAKAFLPHCQQLDTHHQMIFLHAKIEFYLKNYSVARDLFIKYGKVAGFAAPQPFLSILHVLAPFSPMFEWDPIYVKLNACLRGESHVIIPATDATMNVVTQVMNEVKVIDEAELFDRLTELVCNSFKDGFTSNLATLFERHGKLELAQQLILKSIQEQGTCDKVTADLLTKTF